LAKENKTIEVVQALSINCAPDCKTAVRMALVDATKENFMYEPNLRGWEWHHNIEREEKEKKWLRNAHDEIVLFSLRSFDLRTLHLVLLWTGTGYDLIRAGTDIDHPFEVRELNSYVDSFVRYVVDFAARKVAFNVVRGRRNLPLELYIPSKSANMLQEFFSVTNGGTDLDSPLVRERLLSCYRVCLQDSYDFGDYRLYHWLHEVEKWPQDRADAFNVEFVRTLEVLRASNLRAERDKDTGIEAAR